MACLAIEKSSMRLLRPAKLGWAPGQGVVELDGLTQTRLDIA